MKLEIIKFEDYKKSISYLMIDYLKAILINI